MREIVFLAGILAIMLYALGILHRSTDTEWIEDYQIIKCEKVLQVGDTIYVLQTMVKHGDQR